MSQSVSGSALPPVSSGRSRPVMIPWREVARRLAEGEKPSAVAAGLAIDEDRIWRHLRKSLRFRSYLHQAVERQRQLADLLVDGAGRSAMVALGRQPENLDGAMLRCLLDEAGRAGGAEKPARSTVARQIEQLGETGAPPPNMARIARLKEKIRLQNAQFEAICAQDAALLAARQAEQAAVREAARSKTTINEPERSETSANEAKRSETNANEQERSETKPDKPERPLRLRWTAPPEPRYPSIADQGALKDPDAARLRAEGSSGDGKLRGG